MSATISGYLGSHSSNASSASDVSPHTTDGLGSQQATIDPVKIKPLAGLCGLEERRKDLEWSVDNPQRFLTFEEATA
jgi:hypothetical protein